MANSSIEIVETLRINYAQIDDNFDAIFGKCTTDVLRKQLRDSFAGARAAYFSALDKAFALSNPTVQTLADQLDKTNQAIEGQVTDFKDIVVFLNTVSAAVKLATSLASLAA